MEWYHVCWPRLTAKRVEPVVRISWASCLYFFGTTPVYSDGLVLLVICRLFGYQANVLSFVILKFGFILRVPMSLLPHIASFWCLCIPALTPAGFCSWSSVGDFYPTQMGVVLWNCSRQYGESGRISWPNFASVPKKSPNFTPGQWHVPSLEHENTLRSKCLFLIFGPTWNSIHHSHHAYRRHHTNIIIVS